MRVLFLTTEVPHPPHSGGTIKTASVLDYLRRRHEVHLLCFRRRPLTEEQARWCRAVGQVETLLLDRGRTPLSLLSSYLRGLPLSVERNRSAAMTAWASSRLGEGGYDAAFVDGWLMAQYLPEGFAGLTLLHEHNAEYVMWRRQAERGGDPPAGGAHRAGVPAGAPLRGLYPAPLRRCLRRVRSGPAGTYRAGGAAGAPSAGAPPSRPPPSR